jgi:hypothetical protein
MTTIHQGNFSPEYTTLLPFSLHTFQSHSLQAYSPAPSAFGFGFSFVNLGDDLVNLKLLGVVGVDGAVVQVTAVVSGDTYSFRTVNPSMTMGGIGGVALLFPAIALSPSQHSYSHRKRICTPTLPEAW